MLGHVKNNYYCNGVDKSKRLNSFDKINSKTPLLNCKKINKSKLHKSFLSPPAACMLRSSLDSPSSSPIVGSPSFKISKPLLRKIKTCDQLTSLPITPETTPETKTKDL